MTTGKFLIVINFISFFLNAFAYKLEHRPVNLAFAISGACFVVLFAWYESRDA